MSNTEWWVTGRDRDWCTYLVSWFSSRLGSNWRVGDWRWWADSITVIGNLHLRAVPKLFRGESNLNGLWASRKVARIEKGWEWVLIVALVPAAVCSHL
jgi:hypothetical protein